jgi:type II secretory pathway component PulM
MNEMLRKAWTSRSPVERTLIVVSTVILCALLYAALLWSAEHARARLGSAVRELQTQALVLEQHATEIERIRALPRPIVSATDLRSLVQAQAGAAGLTRALTRIDPGGDPNSVRVAFGAAPFPEWLNWVSGLQAQQVRLEACRLEALATPGLTSVAATLVRTGSQ